MFNKNKKGISPLIATVLVIGFTIVLAALVITWGTKLFKTTVEETQTTSNFNLACTTGLKLEATPDADSISDGDGVFDITLRNNNQDRVVTNFQFVLYDSSRVIQRVLNAPEASPTADNAFAAMVGGVENAVPANIKLDFPVPKVYRVRASGTGNVTVGALTKIEVYPMFTIEGTTKACETPITVNL